MRKLALFVLVLSITFPMKTKSQENKLSLDDLIPGGKTYRKYVPIMPQKLAWFGDQMTYVKGDSILIASDKIGAKDKVFTTLEEVNSFLDLDEQLRSLNTITLGKETKNLFIGTKNHIFVHDLDAQKTIGSFKNSAANENIDISEQSLLVAYTKQYNLYIQDLNGQETQLTNDGTDKLLYGTSVHQNEFGISKGTYWSPKGNLLAFYRMDQSMVDVYPLVNTATRMATLKERIYPMAGMKSHHVTVGVYNTKTQKTVYLKTGTPKEKYLTNIAWSPDESTIYIAELNRGQDSLAMNSYDVISGKKLATLFAEEHEKYVEPQVPIQFQRGDASKFVWESKRDGYNHLYLYNTKGELLKQITKGEFEVVTTLGQDAKGENIYYVSTEDSPIEQHLYSVNINSGKKTKLSQEEGVHHGMLSPCGKYILDIYKSQHNPGKVALVKTKNAKSTIFYEAKNPFEKTTMPEITLGTVKSSDETTDLHYRMVRPSNFDASKKYPVIVYVYGGPHSQLVSNTWLGDARGWDIYMAEQGYIMFTLDNRGTANRGFDFENSTHQNLGVLETEDQMTGVNYLKSLPFVDAERIGVHGWSYGGFMTLNMMLRHPETFKVGVAGGPVVDWKLYEIMYGERYMNSPQKNADGYKETNMTNHIGNLEGRLLLIHGDEDPVVLMQHTSQLLRAAVKEGVHPDLFIYPGHEHNVLGKDRIHLHEHITRYFEDFLR